MFSSLSDHIVYLFLFVQTKVYMTITASIFLANNIGMHMCISVNIVDHVVSLFSPNHKSEPYSHIYIYLHMYKKVKIKSTTQSLSLKIVVRKRVFLRIQFFLHMFC